MLRESIARYWCSARLHMDVDKGVCLSDNRLKEEDLSYLTMHLKEKDE
jgi:hypothetical protein